MNLIILAAGMGRRLWPITKNQPKILVSLGDLTLLDHQMESIRKNKDKIEKIVFVLGYRAEMIERRLDYHRQWADIEIVRFEDYEKYNNLLSLWQAKDYMKEDFMIINGDNVFHPLAIEKLLSSEKNACLVTVRRDRYVDSDMKVILDKGSIKAVSKKLDNSKADGISVGIMRFRAEAAKKFYEKLSEFASNPSFANEYYLRVVEAIAEDLPIYTEAIPNEYWTDIDDENDLINVRNNFQSIIEVKLAEV